jgi:hypothetical protein
MYEQFTLATSPGDYMEEIMVSIFARYRILNDSGISITETSDIVLQKLLNELRDFINQNMKPA